MKVEEMAGKIGSTSFMEPLIVLSKEGLLPICPCGNS